MPEKYKKRLLFQKTCLGSEEEIVNIVAILPTGKEQLQNKQLYNSRYYVPAEQ
jgi:hypothetical protein